MDIHDGRLTGDLYLHCYDPATWNFPQFGGRVSCRGLQLHFWDAPDDLTDTNVDLLFEGDRMYLHGAKGYFGAAPIIVTGVSSRGRCIACLARLHKCLAPRR